MGDKKDTTVLQSLTIGRMIEAQVIRTEDVPDTASGPQLVRTVATSLTTGSLSIRYVPRPVQSSGADTTS